MARSLQRIQRIRHLAEEQARLELERETQRLRQAQATRIEVAAQVHHQRVQLAASFASASESSPADAEAVDLMKVEEQNLQPEQDWLLAGAALEFSTWNQMQLEQWCVHEAERVAPIAEKFRERRKEVQQVDRLGENARAAERVIEDRREQSQADSWFQIETARQKRNKKNSAIDTRKK